MSFRSWQQDLAHLLPALHDTRDSQLSKYAIVDESVKHHEVQRAEIERLVTGVHRLTAERDRLQKELHAFRYGVRLQPPMSGHDPPYVHITIPETQSVGPKYDVPPECMIPSDWVDTADGTTTSPQSDNSDIFDQSVALPIDQARCAVPVPMPESPASHDRSDLAPYVSKDYPDRRRNRNCAEGEHASSDPVPPMHRPGIPSEDAFSMWSLPVI